MKKRLIIVFAAVTLIFSVLVIGEIMREERRTVMVFEQWISDESYYKININTAARDELMALPGIGDKRAEKIIKARGENPFERISDIRSIVGESVYEKIKEFITV